jgi:endonuclease YncB( thermonuclease family)
MYNPLMRLFTVFLISLLACSSIQAGTIAGTVVRITDGDTVVVLDANKVQYKIRLVGIDAPEKKQAYGKKSKENLSDLVAGKYVVVEYDKLDRYKRVLGKILLSGKDMNLEQVASGLAWHYKKYQKEQSQSDRMLYSEAEVDARDARRGLWQDSDPIPPWEYRKSKRK